MSRISQLPTVSHLDASWDHPIINNYNFTWLTDLFMRGTKQQYRGAMNLQVSPAIGLSPCALNSEVTLDLSPKSHSRTERSWVLIWQYIDSLCAACAVCTTLSSGHFEAAFSRTIFLQCMRQDNCCKVETVLSSMEISRNCADTVLIRAFGYLTPPNVSLS